MKKAALVALMLLTSCTVIDVQPIDSSYNLDHVCIEDNPEVVVTDFIATIEHVFHDHLITTEVYSGAMPEHCRYRLTYLAIRSWDLAPYLSDAEVRLFKEGERIGYAEYHLKADGGLAMNKWASVKHKMTPVLRQLLAQQ